MIEISGYKITTKIEGDSKTLVCRATRLADNKSFTLKITMAGEYRAIIRFKQEFHIAGLLHRKGIRGEYLLEKHGNQLVLACEHLDGEPLAAICSPGKPNLEELNITLKVLVEKVNTEREQVEKHLFFNGNDLVMPFVDKLEQSRLTERQQVLVNTIRENLDYTPDPWASMPMPDG